MNAWIPAGAAREHIEAIAAQLSDDEARALLFDWRGLWARPEQLMPAGDWSNWVIRSGRGFGKTRSGAEAIREMIDTEEGATARIALVGPTAADCRDVMIEGESGLLSVFPDYQRPRYESSKRRVTFANGALGFVYSAEEPERLRGPQHTGAWLDELAVYRDPEALWDNLKFGLRLGTNPRVVVTTTPRPLAFLRKLLDDPATVVTYGSTFDNEANLAPSALAEFRRVYGGTRIGRQELLGELLGEAEGALWTRQMLDESRLNAVPVELRRIVVAIDPAVTAGEGADETGIVVLGEGVNAEGYVLEDGSCRLPPSQWAHRAVSLFDKWEADRIIAETNNGGDLVENLIRTVRPNISYEKVHASRGKVARAEPVAALYEQGKIHHVGMLAELEDEQANFVPGKLVKSPNRADALVWGATFLMLGKPIHKGRALWM